jgi:hypothetical protein
MRLCASRIANSQSIRFAGTAVNSANGLVRTGPRLTRRHGILPGPLGTLRYQCAGNSEVCQFFILRPLTNRFIFGVPFQAAGRPPVD